MQTKIIIFILIAFIVSAAISFYQYLFKKKKPNKIQYLLFSLRAVSIFLLLLLLINPKIKSLKLIEEQPVLAVLVDNSESMAILKSVEKTKSNIETIKNSQQLNDKFNVQFFSFDTSLINLDTLTFKGIQTDISVALNNVNELYKEKNAGIILLSDGNQTIGTDYEFTNSKKPIYPVITGDTAFTKDIKIKQVNVNKYSYLKNKFPVEVLVNYSGNEEITTSLKISRKRKIIFRKKLRFSSSIKSQTITANLTSSVIGNNYYTISVDKLENEKNIKNNVRPFSVEVINEQTNILILTSFLHPDIGALKKAIESNQQRKVTIDYIENIKTQLNDFQLIILYQPSNQFNNILSELKTKKRNFLLISGSKTDWSTINQQQLGFTKNVINQSENYGSIYNPKFQTFIQKDIGFANFPPLKDKFGELKLNSDFQPLLYQAINGINSNQPLLVTSSKNNIKIGALFGEGLWKWRSESFLKQNNFKEFDDFIGNLVQFLASSKKRNRLEVSLKNSFLANEILTISAFYVDENYQFDTRASLWFTYTNTATKVPKKLPFTLNNNSYTLSIEDLPFGEYTYNVSVTNQPIKKYGKFTVLDYNAEAQFTSANKNKLKELAKNSKSEAYFSSEINNLIKNLTNNKQFFTTQKSEEITASLLDWKAILMLIIGLLSIEWLVRKYHGKI